MNSKKALPTSAEVDRRLRTVAELRNLCLSLGRARKPPPPPADPAIPADRPASG